MTLKVWRGSSLFDINFPCSMGLSTTVCLRGGSPHGNISSFLPLTITKGWCWVILISVGLLPSLMSVELERGFTCWGWYWYFIAGFPSRPCFSAALPHGPSTRGYHHGESNQSKGSIPKFSPPHGPLETSNDGSPSMSLGGGNIGLGAMLDKHKHRRALALATCRFVILSLLNEIPLHGGTLQGMQ